MLPHPIGSLVTMACLAFSVYAGDVGFLGDPIVAMQSVVTFERRLEGIHDGDQTLWVSASESSIRIELIRSDGYREITEMTPEYRVKHAAYFDESGRVFAEATYDHEKGAVQYVRNQSPGKLSFSGIGIECNSVLFAAIPRICEPEDGCSLQFDAIQTPLGRKVPMEVRFVGRESLVIGQKGMDAIHFEMNLRGWKGRLFWPYTYHYWFSVEDGLLMKYEGVDGEKRRESLHRLAQELKTSTP